MSQNDVIKDSLYYTDLIYEIKSLAGFEQDKNEETEERIIGRQKSIEVVQESGPFHTLNELSPFEKELFEIVSEISKKANTSFKSISEISKYPDLVKEVITQLEEKVETVELLDDIFICRPAEKTGRGIYVTPEQMKKVIMDKEANPVLWKVIHKMAEEFRINNLREKGTTKKLTK